MQIHVPTLLYVMTGVMALGCVTMICEWRKWREDALLWWSAGLCCAALGSAAMTLRVFGWNDVAAGGATAALILGYALMSKGAAAFSGQRLSQAVVALGPSVWLCCWCLVWRDLPLEDGLQQRIVVASTCVAAYCLTTAWFLLRMRVRLATSRLLGWAFVAHTAFYVLRIATISVPGSLGSARLMTGFTFTVVMFEGVLFACAVTYLLTAMIKDRGERGLRQASETDFLTGIDNRRAFIAKSARLLARNHGGQAGGALVLFDLDHFKAINDRFGHAFGDEMLKVFCGAVASRLHPGDLFARMGGEEFALVLPDENEAGAVERAIQISLAYTRDAARDPSRLLIATVSAGVVGMGDGYDMSELLRHADRALYRAKQHGRNRIETATIGRAEAASLTVFQDMPQANPT